MVWVDHAARLPRGVAESIVLIRGDDVLGRVRQGGDAAQPVPVVGVGGTATLHGDPLIQSQPGRIAGDSGAGVVGLCEEVLVVVKVVGRLTRGIGPAQAQTIRARVVGELLGAAVGVGDARQAVLVVVLISGGAAGVLFAGQIAVIIVGVGDGLRGGLLAGQLVGVVVGVGGGAENGINSSPAVANGIISIVYGALVGVDDLRQAVQRVVGVGGHVAVGVGHPGAVAGRVVLVGVAGDDVVVGYVVGHRHQPAGLVVLVGDVGAVGVVLPHRPAAGIVFVGGLPGRAGDARQLVGGVVLVERDGAVRIGHHGALAQGIIGITQRLVVHRDILPGGLAVSVVVEMQRDARAGLGDDVPHGVVGVAHVVVGVWIVGEDQAVGVVVGVGRDLPVGVGAAHQITGPIVGVGGGTPQRIGLAGQPVQGVVLEHRHPAGRIPHGDEVIRLVVGVLGDVAQGVYDLRQPIPVVVDILVDVAVRIGQGDDVAAGVIGKGRLVSQPVRESERLPQDIVLERRRVAVGIGHIQQVSLRVKGNRRRIAQ